MKPVFKLLYRVYRIFYALRNWVARRFTPAGWVVAGAFAMASFVWPDTDNNIAYQGFTLLLGLLAISFCFACFFRAKFSVRRILPQFGTVGSPLAYSVQLRNLSPRVQRGLTLLENLEAQWPSFRDWLAVKLAEEKRLRSLRLSQIRRGDAFIPARVREGSVPVAAPGQEVEVRLELTPLKRGMLQLAGVTLARADPLGLFRSFSKIGSPQSILILPKRYPVPPVALPGSMKYQEGGVAMASNVGQSEEFVALRDYRHGDPMRHIHWRSWAKAGKPVVKEFEDEFFVRHALVLDTFNDLPYAEVFEEAVAIAASFACTLRTQESLLDLLFVGPESYCFTAGRGLAHADQMLQILASVRTCPDRGFDSLESLVLDHISAVSGCICVLLAWDEPRQRFIRKLNSLGVPLLVLVVAELGKSELLQTGIIKDEPENFHVLEVGQIEQGLAVLK